MTTKCINVEATTVYKWDYNFGYFVISYKIYGWVVAHKIFK